MAYQFSWNVNIKASQGRPYALCIALFSMLHATVSLISDFSAYIFELIAIGHCRIRRVVV